MATGFIQGSLLLETESIVHGFFGRQGGVSQGAFASLNGGMLVTDDPAAVAINRGRMLYALRASEFALYTLHQVHSARVQLVTTTEKLPDQIAADAMVTADAGIMLGIATADCAPVLLAETRTGVIAAAHAGWRGALAGVLPNTLAAMCRLGGFDPSRVSAVIGPMIQQASFAVGDEVRAAFLAQQSDWEVFFVPASRAGFFLFDLSGLLQAQLQARHVMVERITVDTYRASEQYFSYRFANHRHCPSSGRQLALIGLRHAGLCDTTHARKSGT